MDAATLRSPSRTACPSRREVERGARGPARSAGWYACHTRPRAEKKVDTLLDGQGIESYLPAVPHVHRWCDRKRIVILPLFASYVFARAEDLWRILATPGICDVVRFANRPALIPDREIRNIERFVQALVGISCPAPAVAFQQGERVLITCGPLQSVEGVVVEMKNRCRVLVGLAAIGAGFEVDVPVRALRAIG